MNRRLFLRSLLGTSSALAVAPVLPSEVWPFRKIFLPTAHQISPDLGLYLENIATELPALISGTYPALFGRQAMDDRRLGEFLGLKRSPYPGRLVVSDINHRKRSITLVPEREFQETMKQFKKGIDDVLA